MLLDLATQTLERVVWWLLAAVHLKFAASAPAFHHNNRVKIDSGQKKHNFPPPRRPHSTSEYSSPSADLWSGPRSLSHQCVHLEEPVDRCLALKVAFLNCARRLRNDGSVSQSVCTSSKEDWDRDVNTLSRFKGWCGINSLWSCLSWLWVVLWSVFLRPLQINPVCLHTRSQWLCINFESYYSGCSSCGGEWLPPSKCWPWLLNSPSSWGMVLCWFILHQDSDADELLAGKP